MVVFFCCFATLPVSADVTVDPTGGADHTTIHSGLAAVSEGETVWLVDAIYSGEWNKELSFGGKDITVRSISDNPDLCIIDCEGYGRAFNLSGGESSAAAIRGITVTNGDWLDGGGFRLTNSSPTIMNCKISGNIGGNDGGGVYCLNSSPTIIQCLISDNSALSNGGGIFCDNGNPVILQTIVQNNQAEYGGGLYIESSLSCIVTNCTIVENTAGSMGGGIQYNVSSGAIFTNCTISLNSATGSGGGLDCYDSYLQITNSIFWGNTAGVGKEIYSTGGVVTVEYSDVDYPPSGYPGTGNIYSDPLFAGGSPFDYHLTGDSPCIDHGTDNSILYPHLPADDIDGDARPEGDGYDMGSDEVACIHHGDVNFDGDITAGDAQMTFNIALVLITPTFEEVCAADCNADGSVTAGDAQQIFGVVMGMDSCVDPL